jgi:hypothetical protein
VNLSSALSKCASTAVAPCSHIRKQTLPHAAAGAGSGDNLQDILRILTLWFNHGAAADVEAALQDGFSRVSIDTWLVVIPQVGVMNGTNGLLLILHSHLELPAETIISVD